MVAGKLIVITGPSGVGKGTIVRSLLQRHPEIYLSISTTTRKPRLGEIDGKDYYFVNQSQFEAMIHRGELLEWAEYAGNYYGTPKVKVEEQIQLGKLVLLEIELLGARAIAKIFPAAQRIFILPPSLQELEQRIRKRGTDSEEAIIRRLSRAKEEIAAQNEFKHCLVNDDLKATIQKVEQLIFEECTDVSCS
ncbi:guanylate kinase [Stanieria cyanosphaera PCC 7437]|uniref:Guanylate kinase n=1 Tax=Stanieria cyanosphaera (strain ATCC 29371 / PCC 7437) TaxID=111780 RepID=K9XU80_STAC7|nr:guanylate kinase [Stanieria cyanosphaera]AFZ35619.1 guanylate kinase [Stanieria cyanosphaera PCC 7437]